MAPKTSQQKIYEAPPELDRLLRIGEVCTVTGMAVSTVYLKVSQGKFCKPVKIGSSAVRWRQSEVQAWLDNLQTVEAA